MKFVLLDSLLRESGSHGRQRIGGQIIVDYRKLGFGAKIAFRVFLLLLLCNESRPFKFPITGIGKQRETTDRGATGPKARATDLEPGKALTYS